MDVALHRLPVTFVLDRAGITGEDGASHNGMWDLSILQVVPGLRIAAPRDGRACASCCARPWRSTTARPSSASPRAPVGDDIAGGRPARRAWTCCAGRPTAVDVLIVSVGADGPSCASRSPSGSTRRGSRPPSSTRAGSRRLDAALVPAAARAPAGRDRRGQRPGRAASATRSPGRCATPTSTCRAATSASRSGSSTTPTGPRCSPRSA